ncbi:Putative monooxygenase [BD1-7 clade bacterium]|uniref:Monooxygenase n=1 Tax=BD1-7 clade bacterium TaxID=2029982 RepID=A0A5S9QHL2_9GAMM|nr:Putative monooxygenase [BD1-7 clade bacterium]CAA0117620.1 Putative monooxygenase [BD1-7 clade bacterium]CAA0125269.1 Putative monooxygenase [BD1-7 clade bacterium]
MRSELADKLGLEVPIFAFTHCRDVVNAVSQAGGIGVLGAVGFSLERLKEELDWIDAHIGDKPYGVDIVIPQKYEGMGEMDPEKLEEMLAGMVPQEHHDFATKLLADHGVPEWPDKDDEMGLLGWNEAMASMMVDEAIKRPNCRLIANALGTPPADIIKRIQDSGRLVGALCGKVKQAKQHENAGLDFIIAQGTEGGGHTGEVGSVVLWPAIINAVNTPVLAAGGIGSGQQMVAAMAMGAAGVWSGSLWLAVEEAEAEPAQKQSYFDATEEDTVRSRSWTGKPCRMLRNEWTDAWNTEGNPEPLGMPLQGLVTADAIRRTHTYAAKGECQKVAFNPVGQVVGQINHVETSRGVVERLLTEYVDTIERLNSLMPE